MKKIACVIFELEENETVENVLERINLRKPHPYGKKVDYVSVCNEPWKAKYKDIMKRLMMDEGYKGYQDLFWIMEAIASDPEKKKHIRMNELFRDVEDKTGRDYCKVERSLRTFINGIFIRNDYDYIKEVLNITSESHIDIKPKMFVAILADCIFKNVIN